MRDPGSVVVLEGERLRVAVDPVVGGTIASIVHLETGASVLGTAPWDPLRGPPADCAAPDERSWLSRYDGGWPLLFPNGGDACTFEGVVHGFHGEASRASWTVEGGGASLRLRRRFFTVPVEMRRELSVDGELVTLCETLRMLGEEPVRVMWTHHPTFGADLLDGAFEILGAARSVVADDAYDPPANPLVPGARGSWPALAGKVGPCDLSRPADNITAMAYLHDFDEAWVALRRLDDRIAAALSWDRGLFPCAWLWLELGGTREAPWYGRARLIGVEPSTSWPGTGLADVARRGGPLLRLAPGDVISTTIRLHVFRPRGPIRGVDGGGRALCEGKHP